MTRTTRRTGRPAFTLIELLVVIAIIGILVSLTSVAVFRLIGTQQSANTRSELTRVETEFQKLYRAMADKARQEPIPIPGSPLGNVYYNTVLPMAGSDRGRAQVIWTKLRLKQAFPQTFNEALNPAPMPPLSYYKSTLTALGYTTANTATPQPWESSACLLMALGRGEDNNGVSPEQIGVNSFVTTFPTPNGQTVQALVDGWHNPLAFCRWPVNSVVLNPNGQPLAKDNNDPSDPSGLLESGTWQKTPYPPPPNNTTTCAAAYAQVCHAVGQPTGGGNDATSYRVYPLIASAGPDGQLGLDPVAFKTTNAPQAADNLYPTLAPAQ